ncbi:MAG: SusE domain-containing protein [Bacteroidota bacterium]
MFKYNFFLLALVLVVFTACEETTFDPVLTLGNAPAISSPSEGASFVITEATAADEFANFSWSEADFGVNTQVNYTLEVDLAGNNFSEPAALVPTTTQTSAPVLNSAVNAILINLGLPGGVAQNLEARIKAVVGLEEDGNVLFSAPIALNVTPFEAEIEYPVLYVPGAYQGWDPANEETVIYSVESNGQYDGYRYFPDASTEFKITDGPSWDVNYGDSDDDGILDQGGDNIIAGDAGLYRINVNINDLTYSATKTDWGLIGSATPNGWDADQDMTYDPATGIYSITLDLVAGEIKFRANDDWAINLGDTNADLKMEYGGDNIA